MLQTLGDSTIPDVDLAVPHDADPQRPAPKPYPVKPSSGPLFTR